MYESLAGLRSAAFFDGALRQALHRLKYKQDVILADTLAHWLKNAWHMYALPDEAIVVVVPLSEQRLKTRGYNQADLLARGFAQQTNLRYWPTVLRRTRHTASQVDLSASERLTNVAGAFQASPPQVCGQKLVLVDDVCTTGATLNACAEALRCAGATEVWGLTLARARNPKEDRLSRTVA